MTIDESYRLSSFVINKEVSGQITPGQFNLIAPQAQLVILNNRLQPQYDAKGILIKGFGVNDNIREDLRNLMKNPQTIAVSGGIAAYPEDYIYLDAMTTNAGLPITEATADEIAVLNQSLIKPPSATFPKYVMHQNGFNIYPTSLTSIKLAYLRKPATPIWNYTESNDRAVYAATGGIVGDGNSVDFELDELIHLEIVHKILQFSGLNLGLDKVVGYSVAMQQAGM